MTKPVEYEFAKWVSQFVEIRSAIALLEDEHKKRVAPFKEARDQLEGLLLEAMAATGSKSVRTEHGTCTTKSLSRATVKDPHAFIDYIRATGDFDLIERRASATAVREYVEKHGGEQPPGVNYYTEQSLSVTKPRATATVTTEEVVNG